MGPQACFDEPRLVTFAEFERATAEARRMSKRELLESASELFQQAKHLLDTALKSLEGGEDVLHAADADRDELLALCKVAVANRVALVKVATNDPRTAKPHPVDLDLRFHAHFPAL